MGGAAVIDEARAETAATAAGLAPRPGRAPSHPRAHILVVPAPWAGPTKRAVLRALGKKDAGADPARARLGEAEEVEFAVPNLDEHHKIVGECEGGEGGRAGGKSAVASPTTAPSPSLLSSVFLERAANEHAPAVALRAQAAGMVKDLAACKPGA